MINLSKKRLGSIKDSENFPFKTTLSLQPIIQYWRSKAEEPNSPIREVAENVLEQLQQAPELFHPIENAKVIEENVKLVDLLLSAVFPYALQEDELGMAIPPFQLQPFFTTSKFASDFLTKSQSHHLEEIVDLKNIHFKKTLHAYAAILETFYGVVLAIDHTLIVSHLDKHTHLSKLYKVTINPKFCEIKLNGTLPKLSEEDIQYIRNNVLDLELWEQLIPSDLFEFQGITILHLTDVTNEETLSSLKYDLLEKKSIIDSKKFEEVENKIRVLFGKNNLKLGLAAFQKNNNNFINFGRNICKSMVLKNEEGLNCSCDADSFFKEFQHKKEPLIFHDLSTDEAFGGLCKKLHSETGIKNLLIAPLYNDEEFIGLLELGSPETNVLNSLSMVKLQQIIPLFAIAVKRNSEDLENTIRKIIRTKYTAIHPAVEWKFINAAIGYLDNEFRGVSAEIAPIVFEEVYPLYGASDIRSSSLERNKAIREDLSLHINLVIDLIDEVTRLAPIPFLDQLNYSLVNYKNALAKEYISGYEATVTDFIRNEVEPVIGTLGADNKAIEMLFQNYKEKLDPQLNIVYDRRKAFEESLNAINTLIAAYLDNEEVRLQKMYPHYFEKYKTDGVEYNMYIGSSLTEDKSFDQMYVKNLRLWQLISMAKIAKETAALIPELKIPLKTTQLILVQSAPLSIRFRMDEKRFDVDGAYNVRYEIIKKRIDKALIKGTNERLTKPGTIVIVYSQEKEAIEYQGYIEYLQQKEVLLPKMEALELQDLQDVQGLKAFRVEVNLQNHEESMLQKLLKETLPPPQHKLPA